MDEDAIIKEIISIPHRCYICERLDDIEFDYMSEIQYQVIRNNDVKSDFIKKGFCNYHFWSIASLTTPEAVASMGIMLIENNSTQSNCCLVCDHLRTKEAELVNEFVKDAPIATSKDSDQSGRRFCQPHFRLIMKQLDGEIAEYFSNIQKLHNEQLLVELKSFVEKRNSRHERDKNEKTSWWRAIEKSVGRKGMRA
jgi:hypothetical protein